MPLGLRVLTKIENIIREEMNAIGGQELLLPALHPKENWNKTNRWQTPEMFKLKSRLGKDYGLGWTHEEIITPLVQKFVSSYKDLPFYVYQIQDKFRDELRAKSGLLRGTEFIMKDLYSFHADEKDMDSYYEKVKGAYFKIFRRCGLGKHTFLTLASGGSFSKYSHEFQTVTPYGEDEIHLCQKCGLAVNKEIVGQLKYRCAGCGGKRLIAQKAIEVGNIFKLKTKYTEAFNFKIKDRNGKDRPVLMGCYGIGLGRLMGAIAEVHHDERGIVWPASIAPHMIHLISIEAQSPKVKKMADKVYEDLCFGGGQELRPEVLYDDRKDKTAGEKFTDADLIGIPLRVVVSKKSLEKGSIELKARGDRFAVFVKTASAKTEILKRLK